MGFKIVQEIGVPPRDSSKWPKINSLSSYYYYACRLLVPDSGIGLSVIEQGVAYQSFIRTFLPPRAFEQF
jgi:hypothetical protein